MKLILVRSQLASNQQLHSVIRLVKTYYFSTKLLVFETLTDLLVSSCSKSKILSTQPSVFTGIGTVDIYVAYYLLTTILCSLHTQYRY